MQTYSSSKYFNDTFVKSYIFGARFETKWTYLICMHALMLMYSIMDNNDY